MVALAAVGVALVPRAAGLDVELRLAVGVSLTFPVHHILRLSVVLLDVAQVVLVVVIVAVPLARDPAEELHLSRQGLQLTPELPVLLLELDHRSAQRPAQVGRLLQATLHAHFKGADVHMDLPDGVPESGLVTGQSRTHRLPLWRRWTRVTQVPHVSQGRGVHQLLTCSPQTDLVLPRENVLAWGKGGGVGWGGQGLQRFITAPLASSLTSQGAPL